MQDSSAPGLPSGPPPSDAHPPGCLPPSRSRWAGNLPVNGHFSFSPWNVEIKSASLARRRIHPDPTAVAFHNLLAEGQANAGAGIFRPAVQPLKNNKNVLLVFRSDADAIVLDAQQPVCFLGSGRDVNPGRLPFRNLMALATGSEITESTHLVRSPRAAGHALSPPRSLRWLDRDWLQHLEELVRSVGAGFPRVPTRDRPAVVDELLHPVGPVHGKADESSASDPICPGSAWPEVAYSWPPCAAVPGIVGGHVGELLQSALDRARSPAYWAIICSARRRSSNSTDRRPLASCNSRCAAATFFSRASLSCCKTAAASLMARKEGPDGEPPPA